MMVVGVLAISLLPVLLGNTVLKRVCCLCVYMGIGFPRTLSVYINCNTWNEMFTAPDLKLSCREFWSVVSVSPPVEPTISHQVKSSVPYSGFISWANVFANRWH